MPKKIKVTAAESSGGFDDAMKKASEPRLCDPHIPACEPPCPCDCAVSGLPVVENRVILHIGYDRPRLIVNGVDIAPMVDPDWTLTNSKDGDGIREARLTVTFPVILP